MTDILIKTVCFAMIVVCLWMVLSIVSTARERERERQSRERGDTQW